MRMKDWLYGRYCRMVANRKFYQDHWDDILIHGRAVTYTRQYWNPLRIFFGPYKRIDPTKIMIHSSDRDT